MRTTAQIRKDIFDCKETINKTEKDRDNNNDLWDNDQTLARLRKETELAEKPYKERNEKLKQEIKFNNDKIYKLEKELFFTEKQELVSKAKVKGEHNATSAHAFLTSITVPAGKNHWGKESDWKLDIGRPSEEKVRLDNEGFYHKKTLKKGVKIFHDKNTYGYNTYFAFKGMDLIGVWRKRISEHRGDDSHSECWAGVKILTDNNELSRAEWNRVKKITTDYERQRSEHAYHRYPARSYYGRSDLTYAMWEQYLENMKSFVAIDLTNGSNLQRIGAEKDSR